MNDSYRLKDALALAPMDLCPLARRAKSREWWRYGWAYGFLERRLADAQAPVREKAFRDALAIGFAAGYKARQELRAGVVGA